MMWAKRMIKCPSQKIIELFIVIVLCKKLIDFVAKYFRKKLNCQGIDDTHQYLTM